MTHERSVTPYSSYFSYFLTVASVLIAALMVLAVLLVFFQTAQAQTYTVLYSFTGGTDGSRPIAGVVQDAMGNLYGTTSEGGVSGRGVVFKLDRAGNETVLYAFAGGADGATPTAGVLLEFAGSPYLLYGTTERGGAYDAGVVFRLSVANNETVLHTFTGGADGARPDAGLIRDAAGNFYGTAYRGGVNGKGVVFKLDRAGLPKQCCTALVGQTETLRVRD